MSNGISEWSNKQLVKWQNSFSLPLRAGTKLFVVKRDAVAMSKKNFSQRWGAGGREGGGGGEAKGDLSLCTKMHCNFAPGSHRRFSSNFRNDEP